MRLYTSFLIGLILCGTACEGAGDDTTPQSHFIQATLPTIGDPLCTEAPPTVTVCEWAASVDAVVVGTIERIEPILDTFVVYGDDDNPYATVVDQCDGAVTSGIIVHLAVTNVLSGEPQQSELAIHVGAGQADMWGTVPSLESTGAIAWEPAGAEVPLAPGTTVGLAITQLAEVGKWSLLGETPFTFSETGQTVFATETGCLWSAPAQAPTDFWELESALSNCSGGASDRKELRLHPEATAAPKNAYASICD